MTASTSTGSPCTLSEFRQAWAVHLFTTMGIVVGMLALQAVLDHRPRAAMIWLLATQVIDGVDGPMARALDVRGRVPQIDGYVLDLVIDFVTCVVVPAAFLHEFGLLPGGSAAVALVGLIVFTSALWFSRTDMMTEDHWFRGFPATWNLVAPTLYLVGAGPVVSTVVVIGFSVCSLTNIPFPHPVQVLHRRPLTLSVTVVWIAVLTWAALLGPDRAPEAVKLMLLLAPLYFVVLAVDQGRATVWRHE